MESKKRTSYTIFIGLVIVLGILFSWNYSTFYGLKTNTKYTYGKIVANWKEGKRDNDYSRYEYQVNGIKFHGKQGDKYPIDKMVVIVYDSENPKYSMIAEYPLELVNKKNDTLMIQEKLVDYSWWNYLPVENVSDMWN